MKPIPSPRALPLFGTMLSIVAAGGASKLHLYVDRRHRELGPIYREKIGPVSGVFVADGDYMRKIFAAEGKYPKHVVPEAWTLYNQMTGCRRGLLFMDDEEWLFFRKTMNNIVLKAKQDDFWKASDLVAGNLIETWAQGGGRVSDLEKTLYKWSLEVIVAILLGCGNYAAHGRDLAPSVDRLANTVHQIFVESAALSLIPVKVAAKLRLPVWKRFVLAASSAIEEGKKLLEMLLELEGRNAGEGGLLREMIDTEMEAEDLRRIVTDLILAAGDTTAHTTQWLLHLLSMDLTCQTEIYNQIRDSKDGQGHQSPLLKGALKEALRLYPVAPFLTRFMPRDLTLDGFQIKAEELVLMSLYSTGRNADYFPRPDSFDPGRWMRRGKAYERVTNPNASLPFAMGSRSCIGRKIAETQILVAVSKILQHFIVNSGNSKRIEIILHLITVPAEPVKLQLQPRKS